MTDNIDRTTFPPEYDPPVAPPPGAGDEEATWGGLVVGGPEVCAYCAAFPSIPCARHRPDPKASM